MQNPNADLIALEQSRFTSDSQRGAFGRVLAMLEGLDSRSHDRAMIIFAGQFIRREAVDPIHAALTELVQDAVYG